MMPKGPQSLFWAAIGVAELAAFFAGFSLAVGNHEGLLASLAGIGIATFAVIVNQMADT